MSITVAFRFPLGRYHGTAWDRSVNEGEVEWPPSPWRILRSLVATWYHRWPELPAPQLDAILDALGTPPAYRTPTVTSGHTRHYLPDSNHSKGETRHTDLTLDPFLWVPRDEPVLVRWDSTLSGEQRETLAKLLELVPYLGRSESVCEAKLLDGDPAPDSTWWLPGEGADAVRLLAARTPVNRAALELSSVQVRKQRRTVPPETTWVRYSRPAGGAASQPPPHDATEVAAVRFAVVSRAPLMATHGVLLADEVRRRVIRAWDGGRREVVGYGAATTDHQHAHWLPLPTGAGRDAQVRSFVVWAGATFTNTELAQMLSDDRLRGLSGRRSDGYELKGFPEVSLLLQAAGSMETVAPELCRPAVRWRSLTPYLPVRHRKRRETPDAYLAGDLAKELAYRGLPEARHIRIYPEDELPDRWARPFRRYRAKERMQHSRPGVGLQLEFTEPVSGPILLGQLSHFGYGMFEPDQSAGGSDLVREGQQPG